MFMRPANAQMRMPVLLLSGFLGSGKTTLVNRLLADPALANTAVAVNEFGDVPLDAQLIDHGADQTAVMANGCLCCNLAGDMEDAVMRVFSRRRSGELPDFKRLIIEPSGLADPAPIAQAIMRNPVLSRALRLEAIVTAVDALFAARQIAEQPEAIKQIALADRLVITKSDLAETTALRAALRRLNPLAEIVEAVQGDIPALSLVPASFIDPEAEPAPFKTRMRADEGAAHVASTTAISLSSDEPLAWRALEAWLRRIRLTHADSLLRIKGILHLRESAMPVAIHGVHHVLHTPVQLAAWPDAERRSRIVLITRGLPAGVIEADWAAALPGFTHSLAA
jgi:G3E family GTPase